MTVHVHAAAGRRLSLLFNLSAAAEARATAIRARDCDNLADLWAVNLRRVLDARQKFFDYLVKYIAVNGHRHPAMSVYRLRPELAVCLEALDTAVDGEARLLDEPTDIIERRLRFYDALNMRNPLGEPLYCAEFADRFDLLKETVHELLRRNSPIFDSVKYIDETNIAETYDAVLLAPDCKASDLYGPRYIPTRRSAMKASAEIMNRIEAELTGEVDPLSWMDELRRATRHANGFACADGQGFILHIHSGTTGTTIKASWVATEPSGNPTRPARRRTRMPGLAAKTRMVCSATHKTAMNLH